MNDKELISKLRELAVPAADEATRQKAFHRAKIALLNSPSDLAKTPARKWQWAAGCACVLLVLLWFGLQRGAESQPDAKLLSEMEALFPGQIDAVISRGTDVTLNLSATPAEGLSQPLAVTLRRGKQTVLVLAYSGRKVCVDLGGRRECFEPLMTEEGKVILAGEDFVWSDADPQPVAGFRVRARALSL